MLWERVYSFVKHKAAQYANAVGVYFGVDKEDLTQSGFIAVMEAAATYSPERGAGFITWLYYYLRKAFADACGLRSARLKNDPINNYISIYEPAYNGEECEVMLVDTLSDLQDDFSEVDNRAYNECLRAELDNVLDTINQKNADVLRMHYFDDQPIGKIAELVGDNPTAVHSRHHRGLEQMRSRTRTKEGAALRQYIEDRTPYYRNNGYGYFMRTNTSGVEANVIERDSVKNRLKWISETD